MTMAQHKYLFVL